MSPLALELVKERKICELLPDADSSDKFEASGVFVQDGTFLVVFDNRAKIARIADSLEFDASNQLLGERHKGEGYEGIAFNPGKQRLYLLVESRKHKGGKHEAAIVEYDDQFKVRKDRPLDFAFESSNKGFEAIAYVQRDGEDFILALCEGNQCQGGKKGRVPGGGRIQVFEKKKKRWAHAATIQLPSSLPFVDYSGMAIDGERVAVVSQVNSMVWIGAFDEHRFTWRDAGRLYAFPRTREGGIRYGNVEGVNWLGPSRIVVVSDRRKKRQQPKELLVETDQSIHIFDLPESLP